VEKNKPDPEGLLKALHLLEVEKAEAIFAGDSLIDQDTAHNAGVRFAAVLTGETKKIEFDAAKVTYFVEEFESIKAFVEA
jgi:phosphoglycolate phosphatase-like HAD superfamily hydrolase